MTYSYYNNNNNMNLTRKKRNKSKNRYCCQETVLPCSTPGCTNNVYTLRRSHLKNQRCIFCNEKKIKDSIREARVIDYYADIRY